MRRVALLSLPLLGGALLAYRSLPVQQQGANFTVPEGFAVEEVLAPDLAQSVVSLAFDNQGRLVLGKEFGNIITLIPQPGGGYEQRIFTDQVHTSQGIFFDGPDLLVTGSGPQGVGLYRVIDENGDARGDRVELIELATRTIQDHGPHGAFYGPDGYLYWTHGNFSYIYGTESPLSPVRGWKQASLLERGDPRGFGNAYLGGPAAVFLRKALPSRGAGMPQVAAAGADEWELVAMGFRNHYDGAFNLMGELFTFDSDMEWDRDLPWFRPTFTAHTVPGGDYGYREGTGKHEFYFLDNAPPMEETGRGSPTGVAFLQTYNYPAEYWDMALFADWSRGRVLGSRLIKDGASYRTETINFLYGEPLNVTQLEVGPDGNLYFALGGRSTRGGIYRVVYRGPNAMQAPAATAPIDRLLTMIQPRSAFSRELARTTKQQMGDRNWENQLTAVVRSAQQPAERRVRALELLQVFGPAPDEALLTQLRGDQSWEVRAASTYYLGMKTTESAQRELVARLRDGDPFVQRRAAEALLRTGVHPATQSPIDAVTDVFPLLSSPDRHVRYAARKLLTQINRNEWTEAAFTANTYPLAPQALMALLETYTGPDMWMTERLVNRQLELLRENPGNEQLLDLARVIQRTILESEGVRIFPAHGSQRGQEQGRRAEGLQGGVQPGAAPAGPPPAPPAAAPGAITGNAFTQIGLHLLNRFPSADSMLNREVSRVVAALEVEGATARIAAELANPNVSREQQIHYAWVLSFMESGWTDQASDQMAAFLERAYGENWRGGASFSNALAMIQNDFLANLPTERHAVLAARIEAARPQVATAVPGGMAGPVQESFEEMFENLVFRPDFAGNPAGGVAAYEAAACIACHTFGEIGIAFGPDLTTAGQRYTRADLVRKIVFPHETISDLYPPEEIVRTNGQRIVGIVTTEDANTLTLGLTGQASVNIPKSDIVSRSPSERSVMPEGLLAPLSGAQRNNLIALLLAGPAAIPDTARARVNQ